MSLPGRSSITTGVAHPLLLCACCPAVAGIDWDTWLHAPGMPPVKNSYDTSLATAAYDLASAWHTADVLGIGADRPATATADDLKGWGTAQVCALLSGEGVPMVGSIG